MSNDFENLGLAAQRNSDVSAANDQRVQKQQDWQAKIFKVITHLEDTENLETCQAIADALNERGLTTARGAAFSVPIVSRLRRNRNT